MKRLSLSFSTILIYGGREYTNKKFFNLYMKSVPRSLRQLKLPTEIREVINGGARGADRLARFWARRQGIELSVFEADWDKHGKLAGPLRNEEMADEYPTVGIAFPGGSGTKDMTARLIERGILIMMADESLTAHLKRMSHYETDAAL